MAHLQKFKVLQSILTRCATKNSIFSGSIKYNPLYSSTQVRLFNKFNPDNPGLVGARSGIEETEEEFDQRYLKYFNKPDIDGWELRKGINDMHILDVIPDPEIMKAVFRACRRINDHSAAIRYMEAVKLKCDGNLEIWNYLKEEITPTLNELGISTLEELNYHKPELALGDPDRTPLIEKPE